MTRAPSVRTVHQFSGAFTSATPTRIEDVARDEFAAE